MTHNVKMYRLIGADGTPFASPTRGAFGGHRRLKIYGRLDCASALRFLAKGYYAEHRVFFKDEQSAVSAGYRPCAKCMTTEYKRWKSS